MQNIDNVLSVFLGEITQPKKIIHNVPVDEKLLKSGVVNIAHALHNDFDIDQDNKNVISALFYYFTGNEAQCEKNMIDLNKGLFVIGNPGSGKSIMMQIFKIYTGEILKKNSFQYFNSAEIIDEVEVSGIAPLEKFNYNFDGVKPVPITCYIDDISSKIEKVKHYGTEINVISELITMRYNIYQRYKKLSHFSSNIYPNEMTKIYDERIISRLNEMCNIIELSGIDRRTVTKY